VEQNFCSFLRPLSCFVAAYPSILLQQLFLLSQFTCVANPTLTQISVFDCGWKVLCTNLLSSRVCLFLHVIVWCNFHGFYEPFTCWKKTYLTKKMSVLFYYRMPNQIRKLNFNDTFLDFEHLKSCFPQYSTKVS